MRNRTPGLVVVRTFSKAFGLAGLRVGYAILPADLEDARRLHRPYPVSRVAVAAATAALEVADEIAALLSGLSKWAACGAARESMPAAQARAGLG